MSPSEQDLVDIINILEIGVEQDPSPLTKELLYKMADLHARGLGYRSWQQAIKELEGDDASE